MSRTKTPSPGTLLAERLKNGIRAVDAALLPGARELPALHGMTKRGEFIMPLENVLAKAADILVRNAKTYKYGDQVVIEMDLADNMGPRLVSLRTGTKVESGAASILANVLVCENMNEGVQFPPTRQLVDLLLRSEPVLGRLPQIACYSRVPVFDDSFVFCGPGWHPEQRILVHGPEVHPAPFTPPDPSRLGVERLPPHLRILLGGFCFASRADLANAVAWIITGVLRNHFIIVPKPVGLLDGNQPGVGKTFLCRTVGMVLGGTDPRLIHYTPDDEELGKRLCATLRESQTQIIIIDNAKVKSGSVISSPAIEANCMSPEISLRILGESKNMNRPNDVLWAITMNDTKTSPDLVSRSLPIRLAHEGDPRDRHFAGPDPVKFARDHRVELLGEIAGIIIYWNQLGRPEGTCGHRCDEWARIAGGIMTAIGLPEFLGNISEATATFSIAGDELAALAEAAVTLRSSNTVILAPGGAGG